MRMNAVCRWTLSNVLVAGRRLNGEAWGKDESEAVRRFAARNARDLHVDVSAAVAGALRDHFRRVTPKTGEPRGATKETQ